jgi:hypothetical protein
MKYKVGEYYKFKEEVFKIVKIEHGGIYTTPRCYGYDWFQLNSEVDRDCRKLSLLERVLYEI